MGRFISADAFVQAPASPQTLNRYSYAANNPVRYVDPSGNFWFIIAAIVEFVVAHATEIAIAAATTAATAAISNEIARQRENQTSPSAPSAVAPQNLTLGQRWNNFATNPAVAGTASAYAGFVPGAGELQDYWAARYGVDVFTNDQIPWGWRLAAGALLFVPLVGVVQLRQGTRALNHLAEDADELLAARRSVVEAVEGAEAAKRAPAIVGENMKRVNKYAREVGGLTIDDWLAGRTWTPELNDQFIEAMKVDGRDIMDIGPDFKRRLRHHVNPAEGRPPSTIYGKERGDLLDYDNYRRVYQRRGKYQGGVPGLDF